MPAVTASDGARLYAERHEPRCGPAGAPPLTVVLSCALCTTHENWRPQVDPLRDAGCRVVLWDYRGHGSSDVPEDPEAYTMAQVVDDLGRVLDWADADHAVVLAGLSFGGLASLHYALAHPDRVRALVLVDSGPGFKNPDAQARWEEGVERTAGFLEARGMEAFVASRAADTAVGTRPELPAARAAAAAIAAQDPHGVARFARRVAGPAAPVIDELASIPHPCLVIVGEKDEPYLRAAEVLAARLPRAERVTIPRAGHVVNIEEAEAFNAVLVGFLQKVAGSSSD